MAASRRAACPDIDKCFYQNAAEGSSLHGAIEVVLKNRSAGVFEPLVWADDHAVSCIEA
jgi:hypothetical protein